MQDLSVRNLIIEITRKCNLQCIHCLRGESENLNANIEHFKHFAQKNNLKNIDIITFSGGEPFLNTQYIFDFINVCKDLEIEVQNFFISTNATKFNSFDAGAIFALYEFCLDNEISSLRLSSGEFYENQQGLNKITNLFKIAFVQEIKNNHNILLNEGLAKENGLSTRNEPIAETFYIDNDENLEIDGNLYLNAKGVLIAGCDFAYNNQDNFKICNYKDNFKKAIKKFI